MSTQAPSMFALAAFPDGAAGGVEAASDAAQAPSHEDWEKLMGAIGDRLNQIWAVPGLRLDAIVQEIFSDLLYAREMPDLVADIERLCDRVAHLMAHPEDFRSIEVRSVNAEKVASAGRIRLRL